MAAPSQHRALGALFALLALGFAGIAAAAIASASGARAWVVGLAAVAIGVWLASLAVRALRRP
jgi:hypothetical protein